MLRDIPFDTRALEARFVEVNPRLDNDGEQRRDPQGRALYSLTLAATITIGERRTFDALTVTIPAQADDSAPLTGTTPYSPVTLTGFRARPWSMEGRSGIAFSAESASSVTQSVPLAPVSATAPTSSAAARIKDAS